MNAADDIAEFLATRRANIAPEQAGLPSYGRRRVPGLRREEVASLAGVSADYYRRLERGQVSGVSDLVLEALARALQLDDAERAHLFDLAHAASPVAPRRSRPARKRVRPVVQRLLDQIEAPAIVLSVHADVLAANVLGRALYAPVFDSSEQPANTARFTFLDPAARDFFPDWERLASELVAALRSQAGRHPHDRSLQDLIGELSTRSDEFRVRWAAHNVRFHQTGTKRLHHPVVGELELSYETLTLDADDGLRMALFTAEAGSASQQALDLLASWTATTPEARPRGTQDDDPCHDSCPDAEQRRHVSRRGPRRLPKPARGDRHRRRDRTEHGLPPHRHGRGLRQRASGRRRHAPLRHPPRRDLRHHQAVDQRLRLRGCAARLRRQPAPSQRRPRRPVPAAPARADRLRGDHRRLQGRGEDARRRPGARHRRLELRPGASPEPDRPHRRRAGGQPGRAAPVLHAARAPGGPRRAGHRHPGVVAARRRPRLQARRRAKPVAR